MKNQQKGFIVPLIIVVVALLAIGGGAYIYMQNRAEQQLMRQYTDATSTQQQTVDKQTTSVSSSQSAEMQTYTGTHFSIQYPIAWSVVANHTDSSSFDSIAFAVSTSTEGQGINMAIYHYGNGKTGQTKSLLLAHMKLLFGSNQSSNFTETNFSINGLAATRVDYLDYSEGNSVTSHPSITQVVIDDPVHQDAYLINRRGGMTDDALFAEIYNSFEITN